MTDEPVVAEESATPATENQADQSENQQTGDVAAERQGEKPRKSRAERRIARLTERNYKAMEENAELKKRLDALEAKLSQPKLERPLRDSYESQEDYEDALFDYRDKTTGKPSAPEPVQVDPELKSRFKTFCDTVSETKPEFLDFAATATFPCTDEMLNSMIELGPDEGSEVFERLQSNPKEAARIFSLSPRRQAIELENFADSLDEPKAVSSAPEPIQPVSGQDAPIIDESNLSPEARIRKRQKQIFGR